MTWLVLPVKSVTHGKSRLSPYLNDNQRRALNEALLVSTLTLAARYPGVARTLVVSRCPEVLATARACGANWLREEGNGLNQAVEDGVRHLRHLRHLRDRTDAKIVILSCDLPLANESDLRSLASHDELVIATDRAGLGTNAICMPAGSLFSFQYGPLSRQRHVEESRQRGLNCRVVHRPGLAFDLDTVADYREWRHRSATHHDNPEGPLHVRSTELGRLAATAR